MSSYLLELASATRLPDVWHTEVGEAEYHVTIHKPSSPGPGPAPPPGNISCDPCAAQPSIVLQIDRRRYPWNKVETVLIGAARVGRSNSFPVQFCPSGVPCPKCGKPSCVCPKWAHVAEALED